MTDNFEKKVAVDGLCGKCGRAWPRPRFPQARLCRQGPLGPWPAMDGGAQA